ncbi:MAG TPA: ABC transporter permease [Saprospiraceae bacterium]|nr:ABC transporter permease [Saprospiraceae bacterium]HMQ85881.1 ABC transporter permease [Saprospiraceae bacterium]
MIFLRILNEAIGQALSQLRSNKLRSFLSLLGVSIGILCIMGVLSAVDSLENNIRGSLQKLGSNIVYVQKWPWADTSGDWWEYLKRPNPDHKDFVAIAERAELPQLTSYHVVVGFRTLKYESSSVENTLFIACSQEFAEMFNLKFYKGRYYSPSEYFYGSEKAVIGYKVAEELFGALDPIGKTIKMSGRKFEVIGVVEKAGDDLINVLDFDDCILLPYTTSRSMVNLKANQIFETTISIKAEEGVNMQQLKDEVKGIMRSHHRLQPREKDDFSLNELTMITSVFDSIFGVLNLIGIVIGLFAMLVGIVSVANIMFVSVKERTNIIGVKKALGAKRYVILLEFLIESVVLCLFGGAIGLLLVVVTIKGVSSAINFDMYLSMSNTLIGILVSVVVGIIAGIIPAFQAAGLDPVEAMRR